MAKYPHSMRKRNELCNSITHNTIELKNISKYYPNLPSSTRLIYNTAGLSEEGWLWEQIHCVRD